MVVDCVRAASMVYFNQQSDGNSIHGMRESHDLKQCSSDFQKDGTLFCGLRLERQLEKIAITDIIVRCY